MMNIKAETKTANEMLEAWDKAYIAAVNADDADAIAALVKIAPGLKRINDQVSKLSKPETVKKYEAAEALLSAPITAKATRDERIAQGAALQGAHRKMNSLVRFVETVHAVSDKGGADII